MGIFSNAPKWRGKRFEEFVINKFDPKYFDIIEQTHSWKTNQDRFVKSNGNPNYTLRYKPTKEEFAVECKYRSHLNPYGMLEYCEWDQFEHYKKFMETQKIPVYIVVGLGGDDKNPNSLYILPLKDVKDPILYPNSFLPYSKIPKTQFFLEQWKIKLIQDIPIFQVYTASH
jgi:hypothetical protein